MSKKITDLEIIVDDLEKKIKKLQIEESNLKSSIHSESMRIEAQKKLNEVELVGKENSGKARLDSMEAKINQREKVIALSEAALKDRIVMVEKREQQHVYLEKKFEQLNKERKDYEAMKRQQQADLDKLKEETAIFSSKEADLIGREDGIRGREKALAKKEFFIQDEIGRLTEWEKRIRTQIEHLEGLKKELSYVG